MRDSFVKTITELAEKDSTIMLVIGDTGFGAFEEFETRFPKQFINVGIAEQQFVSFSAGLALSGMKVFAYNVCTFMSRAMEQIRLELSYQKAGVVLVGVGGGFSYASGGPTHHSVEDISQFRALPNMTVVCPCDPIEMREATRQTIYSGKPAYIRICKNNDPTIYNNDCHFEIGEANIIREGADIAILAAGGMVKEAITTADILNRRGVGSRVVSMHTIKPIDSEIIIECSKKYKAVFTMEENTILGGLGGAVAEVIAVSGFYPNKFRSFGINDTHAATTGTRDYLNELYGLNPTSMADEIMKEIALIMMIKG